MRLVTAYVRITARMGWNYVRQTRELRLLAGLGIAIYLLCSVVMGMTLANSMSQQLHEHAPEIFSAWFNRRLTWGIGFIAVVTMLATVATLFQSAQRDELERLRLLPIPDVPFFTMRVLDICMGVMLFFPLLVALPILRFCWLEGISLGHGLALFAGIVLVTLQICFVHMSLAVFAACLVPDRLVRNKGALYVFLAALAAACFLLAVVLGRREGDVPVLADFESLLPGRILRHALAGEPGEVWRYLGQLAGVTAVLGAASHACYSRLYLRRFDLLMDKLAADDYAREEAPGSIERLLDACAPVLRRFAGLMLRTPEEQHIAVALTRKELRSILRDPSVHLVLFFALLFIALPGLMFSAREPLLGIQVTWFLSAATILTLNAVLAVSSVGREGVGLTLIAHLPVRTEALLFAKASAATLLHGVLSVGLAGGVLLLPLEPANRLIGALATWLLSAGSGIALSFLSVGLGAIFPRFDAKNQFLAINRFGVAVFFGLITLLTASMVGAAAYPAVFGLRWIAVPFVLLMIWAYVAGILYVEGSRRLRVLLALV